MSSERNLDTEGGSWSASQYLLKAELPRVAAGVDVGCEDKRGMKNDF